MTPTRKHLVLCGAYTATTVGFAITGFAIVAGVLYAVSLVALMVIGSRVP